MMSLSLDYWWGCVGHCERQTAAGWSLQLLGAILCSGAAPGNQFRCGQATFPAGSGSGRPPPPCPPPSIFAMPGRANKRAKYKRTAPLTPHSCTQTAVASQN